MNGITLFTPRDAGNSPVFPVVVTFQHSYSSRFAELSPVFAPSNKTILLYKILTEKESDPIRESSGLAGRFRTGQIHLMDISHLRRDYTQNGLRRRDLEPDPFAQFMKWFSEAQNAELNEPNAMSLATVDEAGRPSQRTVLLKEFSPNGFGFFTDYRSAKARHLELTPFASMLFPWLPLERQVAVTGIVERMTRAESEAYFNTRPYGSRIGASVSRQSAIVASRAELEAACEEMMRRHPEGSEIPLPENWGGYRLKPDGFEFWQGRSGRLHDRFKYTLSGDTWTIVRLSP